MQHLRDVLSDLHLRVDDPVHPEARQDPVMRLRARLGPDRLDPGELEVDRREDRRLEVRPHGDERDVAVAEPRLLHRLVVAGIDDHGLRQQFGMGGHAPLVDVDAHHLVAEAGELLCDGAAEIAESDDAEGAGLVGHGNLPSIRLAMVIFCRAAASVFAKGAAQRCVATDTATPQLHE